MAGTICSKGGIAAVVIFNSSTKVRSSLAGLVMDWVWGRAEDSKLTRGWTSFAIVATVWLVESRLCKDDLMVLMVSEMLMMCFDCLAVVALMNSHLCSMFVVIVVSRLEILLETAEMMSVEIFSVSLCMIRNSTTLIMEAVGSGVLLSRDSVNRILARVVAEKFLLIVMRACCSR